MTPKKSIRSILIAVELHGCSKSVGMTVDEAHAQIVAVFKEMVPKPYLIQDDRDDVKRGGGWNRCREEILNSIGEMEK